MHKKTIVMEIDKPLYEVIDSVQYDRNSRFVHVKLLNNSLPFDLTNKRIILSGSKPDGEEIFNTCKIEEGLVVIEITEEMNAVPGISEYSLEIYGGDMSLLQTKNFKIKVTPSVRPKKVESRSEVKALTDALSEVQNIDNRFAETNAQLSKKLDENSVLSMANMGQDVKEAMTGGSVAVVGVDAILTENIVNGQVTPLKTNFVRNSTNLVDKRFLSKDKYVDANGEIVDFEGYYTTDFIEVQKNIDYTFSNPRTICYFDENFAKVSFTNNSTNAEITKSTPVKATYVRCSFKLEYLDSFKIEIGSQLTAYETGGLKSEKLIIEFSNLSDEIINSINYNNMLRNKLKNKILLNLGDSIAFGSGNNGVGYAEIIANKYDMIYHDYSNGGATIGMTEDNNILTQLDNAIASGVVPDYVIFDGGTNDISPSYNVPLGAISDDYQGITYDTTTFCGGLEQILKKIRNTWINTKIIYVRVHNMASRDVALQKLYGEKALEICEKWSVPVVDLFKNGQLNTNINVMLAFTNNNDKTHPNRLGYDMFYIPLIENKLNSI